MSKEYNNIFAKIINNYNSVTPILKKIKYGKVRINSGNRILKRMDDYENSESIIIDYDLIKLYLLMNSHFINLIPKNDLDNILDLLNSSVKEDKIIGLNILYTFVENKKQL